MVGSFLVLFKCFWEYENVVHIDDHPSFSDFFLEGLVHVGLECDGGIAQAEKHDFQFEMAKRGGKGCFPAVVRVDQDVVISGLDIHLGEVFHIA